MKRIPFALLLFFAVRSFAESGQPSQKIKDPAVEFNFMEQAQGLALHQHKGTDGSLQPADLIPQTDSTYDLGSSTKQWANLYVDRVVVSTKSYVIADSGNGHGSTNTRIRRFSNSTSVGTAITYADSASNGGSFTINEDGLYFMRYTDSYTGGGATIGISVNSNQLTTSISSITKTDRYAFIGTTDTGDIVNCSVVRHLSSGDVVRAHTNGNPDETATVIDFIIVRIW